MKTVSILCVGEELLDGRTRDQNAIWLARASTDHGFDLSSIHIIGDAQDTIINALEEVSQTCDFLVVSGGLGPTADDITRDAASKWLGAALQLDESALRALKQRFAARGYSYTANNRSQCLFPAGAKILKSDVGTAAGFAVENNDCVITFLPGVPREFRWFIEHYMLPQFKPAGDAEDLIHRERLVFFGAGESWLESQLEGIEELASEVGGRVSYLAKAPLIEIHLKAPGAKAVSRMLDFTLERVSKWVIARGDQPTEARIGALLQEQGATVSSAESCTGGKLAARFVSVSGASNWFERGFITYSNDAKTKALGVSAEIIDRFGAVSPQVVCQMAAGAQKEAGATYALSISGIAGPTGGTPDKPVGTVHFALAAPDGVWHFEALFAGKSREQVTSASAYTSMALLLWHLEGRMDEHAVAGPFQASQVWSDDGVD